MTTKTIEKPAETVCKPQKKYSVSPKSRVMENDESFILEAEMPGISDAEAEITIHRNELTIAGEAEELDARYERRFKLPATINTTNVVASMKFGILKLVLPKMEEAKPKTIKVLAG